MRLKRILLATDLSVASMAAERLAADLARTLGAEIVLLFCAVPLATSNFLVAPELAAVLREQDSAVRRELGHRARVLRSRVPRLRSLVATGEAAPTIVESARKLRADLIVLGTHGRGGLSRWTIGSVAERVVRTAACPVLTVRARRTAASTSSARATTRARKSRSVARSSTRR